MSLGLEQILMKSPVLEVEPHKLGPIDKWTRVIDPKAKAADSFKQQQLNKDLWNERTNEVHKYIAKWAYTHGKLLVYYAVFTFQSSLDVFSCTEH